MAGLAPQKDWAANDPTELGRVLESLEEIRTGFNAEQAGGKWVSLADLIVLGGAAAIERAAASAGVDVDVTGGSESSPRLSSTSSASSIVNAGRSRRSSRR